MKRDNVDWLYSVAAVLFAVILFDRMPVEGSALDDIEKDAAEVNNWALRFGKAIVGSSTQATCLQKITDNFQELGATVEWVDATQMIEEMRADVETVLSWKTLAVDRIREAAEYAATGPQHEKSTKFEYYLARDDPPKDEDDNKVESNDVVPEFKPRKHVRELELRPHRNFANAPVNFNRSSIHVPLTVYDQDPKVQNSIKWSEYLTLIFINNLAVDPSLNWQYFGSSTGFLRTFPATSWTKEGKQHPDLYDCRTRSWYVKAAASAKDIVILVDSSGSMTGIRKEIARNVVTDILATLTEDDFVTILSFSDEVTPVVPCFENSLVQANDENIREFIRHMKKLETANIANFTLSLITAFEVLQKYNRSGLGTQCNQAIMIITDGAPNTFEDIFRRYNYPNIPVRVFTYLIGKEVTESHEVNWMACANKGYYTHMATLSEVRDKVLKYVPVMSRPLVLSGAHPYIWTSVYADVPIPRSRYKKQQPLQLMTTVATPVFDKRNPKSANLLGVAGTDVPIREITKLTRAYKIGVNAYSFAITNNGHVLYHPELRPLFHDLLKPGYRNVDLTEVELVDADTGLYEFNEALLTIRKNMIDGKIGWGKMSVKIPTDGFKRIVTRNNSYYYGPVNGTPFSLAVALPEPYGHYRVIGQIEVKRREEDWLEYFRGENWRVHPNWVYCENLQKQDDGYTSAEDNIRIFLTDSLASSNFRWRTRSTRPPIFDKPICEKDLIQSLVFDAKATAVDSEECDKIKNAEKKLEQMFGLTLSFVATRSGLLRFIDYRPPADRHNSTEKLIFESHTKATEEEFYRRAVDFHNINSSAFVFSVPFDAANRKSSLVTGSHAIFLGKGKKKAPAAVVGLQFQHSKFAERFFDTTSKCMQECRFRCRDEELDCFLLDNNGFIVVSEKHEHTGKFFGEIDYTLFDSMIETGIYKKVHAFDYQAICLEIDPTYGFSPYLLTPLHQIRNILNWIWSKLALLYIQFSLYEWWSRDWVMASSNEFDYENPGNERPNKTVPHPCEKEIDLFEMLPREFGEPVKGRLSMCHSSGCDKQFIVQQVPYTNLVMLVVYTTCPCETTSVKLEPKEVKQNETLRCLRMKQNIYRRRPSPCINYHPEETDMNNECGSCSVIKAFSISNLLLASAIFHYILLHFHV
ncbi:voltage-dependent calcium channel subunit alpha-2/delta-3-like isoform X2 [Argiope bruennichi]|uniref:voltage-dependent calcium channel subunit alpha-2/delta-3-like isoform X2 n=1 Tax=Argiope bruennichi TaxID=94029 RepID=UPI00249427FB|nr:voltage-dependent calcium channel subunit alpha-2/delta-3-like isoform X2 [Argiope bruennichi]